MRANNINFSVKCAAEHGEIYLYDVIGGDFYGGISAKQFADELNKLKNAKTIDLRINSPGGDVFEGFAMFSLLKSHKAKISVYVDGLAASIASVIAMAGDSIEISPTGYFMIHDPWSIVMGSAPEFRKQADLLDKIRDSIVETYVSRTKGDQQELSDLMEAETWLNAEESVDRGFADTIGAEAAVAARVNSGVFNYKKIPEALVQREPEPEPLLSFENALRRQIRTLKQGASQ